MLKASVVQTPKLVLMWILNFHWFNLILNEDYVLIMVLLISLLMYSLNPI